MHEPPPPITPKSPGADAQRFAAAVLVIALVTLAVFGLWYHFPTLSASEVIADVLNTVVALGTLSLAVVTWNLAKYTLQSVRASESLIAGEKLRHEQSLAPILTTKLVTNKLKQEISAVIITNAGLGPALEISIAGNVQYEQRSHTDDGSLDPKGEDHGKFIVTRTAMFPINFMVDTVGAGKSTIVTTDTRPGWVISALAFGANDIKLTYRDVFGNFSESLGGHLYGAYYYWRPDPRLFSADERAAKQRYYFEKAKKKL